MILTLEQLKKIFPATGTNILTVYLPLLNKYMPEYGITSYEAVTAFLAQVGHESGGFHYTEEIASGAAYDTGSKAKALGNTPEADGDGQKYKGRGLIQITGAYNYAAVGHDLRGNPTYYQNAPEELAKPSDATESACWYWQTRRLTEYAEKPTGWTIDYKGVKREKFEYITILINGGLNGYADRAAIYARARSVLKP